MNEMLITTIVSAITGIGGFIWGIRKDKEDLMSKSLNNLQIQMTIYEQIIENLRGEIILLVGKVENQQKIIKDLEDKIEECLSPRSNI